MKIIIELELDETWTPERSENIKITEIVKHAVKLSEGVKIKKIYSSCENDKQYDLIERLVCNFTGIEPNELSIKTRKREVVEARQICHYLAKHFDLGSLSAIGHRYGNMHHASAMNSITQVSIFLESDKIFKNKYQSFIESIINGTDISGVN